MTNILSDEELTQIYKRANGEQNGKARPLTTDRIFAAMRAAYALGQASNRKQVLLEAAAILERKLVQPSGNIAYGILRRMAEGEKE